MGLLPPAAVEQYARDGFTVLRGVVGRDTLAVIEQAVEQNMAAPSGWSNEYEQEGGGRFFDDYVNWQRIPAYADAALRGVLPRVAGELMATPAPRFFHEHVLVKEPGTTASMAWTT